MKGCVGCSQPRNHTGNVISRPEHRQADSKLMGQRPGELARRAQRLLLEHRAGLAAFLAALGLAAFLLLPLAARDVGLDEKALLFNARQPLSRCGAAAEIVPAAGEPPTALQAATVSLFTAPPTAWSVSVAAGSRSGSGTAGVPTSSWQRRAPHTATCRRCCAPRPPRCQPPPAPPRSTGPPCRATAAQRMSCRVRSGGTAPRPWQ